MFLCYTCLYRVSISIWLLAVFSSSFLTFKSVCSWIRQFLSIVKSDSKSRNFLLFLFRVSLSSWHLSSLSLKLFSKFCNLPKKHYFKWIIHSDFQRVNYICATFEWVRHFLWLIPSISLYSLCIRELLSSDSLHFSKIN